MTSKRVVVTISFEAIVSRVEEYDEGLRGWRDALRDDLTDELNSNWCQTETPVTVCVGDLSYLDRRP